MRLDKFLTQTGTLTRSESRKAAKEGALLVNGSPVKDPSVHIDPEKDSVTCRGIPVAYQKYVYIMLNKPEGVVSATEDGEEKTVLSLLPEVYTKMGLFPCGRLDKNTTGLLLLMSNGPLCHRLLSPKCHVAKTYRFTCERPLRERDCELLRSGVDIGEKSSTSKAELTLFSDRSGEITVTEGKYHQIKRMFQAVCNKITTLERVSFAGIPLDPALKRGEWRPLTAEEQTYIESLQQ